MSLSICWGLFFNLLVFRLGLAYAGSNREDVLTLLLPVMGDSKSSMEVSGCYLVEKVGRCVGLWGTCVQSLRSVVSSCVWWLMSIISVLVGLRQEESMSFSLGYRIIPLLSLSPSPTKERGTGDRMEF